MQKSIVEILETLENALEHCDMNNLHLAAIHLSSAITALQDHVALNTNDTTDSES